MDVLLWHCDGAPGHYSRPNHSANGRQYASSTLYGNLKVLEMHSSFIHDAYYFFVPTFINLPPDKNRRDRKRHTYKRSSTRFHLGWPKWIEEVFGERWAVFLSSSSSPYHVLMMKVWSGLCVCVCVCVCLQWWYSPIDLLHQVFFLWSLSPQASF